MWYFPKDMGIEIWNYVPLETAGGFIELGPL